MVGKVFISCGQREGERAVAEKIKNLLKEKFYLDSYLAFKVQGLDDIMKITEELKASDYYLFIDFLRKGKDDLACSLFTHQELALAHHVGFRDIIALQEDGAPLEGFLRYVLSNPEHFKNEEELLQKIEHLVTDKMWNKSFSRNLVLSEVFRLKEIINYTDLTGTTNQFVWQGIVTNKRPDVAAVNAVCILDSVKYPDGTEQKSQDRSYLKWARQSNYLTTILPEDFAVLDLFALHADTDGLFLHSILDFRPRSPISTGEGKHIFRYKLFSEGFPLLSFSIEIDYHKTTLFSVDPNLPQAMVWSNATNAQLLE